MRIPADVGKGLLLVLVKKLIVWLLPYIAPVLLLVLLFFFVFSILFLLPKYIVKDVEAGDSNLFGKVAAIFTTGERDDWKLADDQKLYQKYKELDQNWLSRFMDQEKLDNSRVDHHEGNAAREDARVKEIWGRFYEPDGWIPAERSQAIQHSVSWALLAAVDRVLGDPVITGQEGRRPDPEGHFKELEPKLEWRDFDLYYRRTWTEIYGAGANARARKNTAIYKHRIRLLAGVQSYEADKITYHWKIKRYYYKDPHSDLVEEAVYPEFKGFRQQGPYFEKLRNLLLNHQLVKESDLELVLNLAMNYDEEFKYNVSLISGNITELFLDTENTTYQPTGPPGRFLWPAGKYMSVSSGYGWRKHPVLGGLRFHRGIDIAVPRGAPVLSAWDGKVILAGWVSGYGKTVIIEHGQYRTLYAHLMSYEAEPGREVRQGEQIGRADSTGLSTGDHLHFEVRSGRGQTNYHNPMAVYRSLPGGEDDSN
ncbi:MAG: M23 family metallopeptidase [Bacillota bacterium]